MAYVHTRVLILMFVSEYCLAADYSPPRITYPNSSHNLYYENGATVNIRCAAEGNPAPTYKWLENDTELRPSTEVHTTGILEISSFSLRQQASYRCIATNQYGPSANVSVSTMSPTIRLWKLRLERFISQTDIIKNLTEYEYLVLPCIDRNTSATPLLRFVWRDTGTGQHVNMDGGRLYIAQGGSLHFTYVLFSDGRIAGYRCGISASQSDGFKFDKQGARYVLNIKAATRERDSAGMKPQFKYSNSGVYGTILSAATLECVFGGYSPTGYPKQSWVDVKGTAAYVNGDKYTISVDGRQMTIHNLTEADERFYICSASYDPGLQSSCAVFLNVTAPPVFTSGPPTDQVGIQDSSVQFTCDARSVAGEVPPSPPKWYVNSQRMETSDSDKFQLSDDRKVLTVMKLRKHLDVMCVQCQVVNHVDTVIASACLDVLLPIQISKQPNATQGIKYGKRIDLTVNASTDPSMSLSYRWYSPNATYDEGNIPKYMYFNLQSKVAFIDTSKMSPDEYMLAEGMYNINIFHQHESRIVRTQVKLLDKSVRVTNSTLPATDERVEIVFWVTLSLLCFLMAAVIIILSLFLSRWKNKITSEEEEGETVEASGDEPRHEYITEFGSSVDSN